MKSLSPILTNFEGITADLFIVRGRQEIYAGRDHNLVLNSGLDKFGTVLSPSLSFACAYGDSAAPVKRDSGSIQMSQTGTDLSADGAFFELADEGRQFKWDTGEVSTIVTYTDSQNVIVSESQTVAAGEGTMHYVNDTTLGNQLAITDNHATEAGDNGSSYDGGTGKITHKHTHLFPAIVSGPITVRELGWTNTTGGGSLFSRLLVNGGTGIVLQTGDILKVVSNNVIVQSPQTPLASTPGVTGSWDPDGTGQVYGFGLAAVGNNGSTAVDDYVGYGARCLEPSSSSAAVGLGDSASAHSGYGSNYQWSSANGDDAIKSVSVSGYAPGSYTRTKSATFAIGEGNLDDVNCVGLCHSSGVREAGFRHLLDTTQEKLDTHELTLTFRFSWGRTLVN